MYGKRRHGCLTAWLVLMLVANAAVGLFYLLAHSAVAASLSSSRAWAIPVDGLLAVANVVFVIALFRWKRWGFYGVAGTSVVAAVVNIAIGLNALQVLVGLVAPAVLYGVLQIGGDSRGWAQLE
jgi:hypothetical protein